MVGEDRLYAVLVHIFIGLLVMVESGQGVVNIGQATGVSSKTCPDHCKCDGINIKCDCFGGTQELRFHQIEKTSTVVDIRIENCNKVILTSEAVKDLKNLRFFQINNVKDLHMEQRSLNWCGASCTSPFISAFEQPSLHVNIRNTTINEVQGYVFSQKIGEIYLQDVKINRLKPLAFTNLKGLKRIIIKNTVLNGIEAQAFKKFSTENFDISNTKFGALPSRTFVDIEVIEEFKIQKSIFDTIKPLSFIILYPKKVEIFDSQFNEVEGDSFKITAKGRVIVKNNYFKKLHKGAFMGFNTTKDNSRLALPEFIFSNNTLNELKKDTLMFNTKSFTPKFGLLNINQSCSCAEIHIWQSNVGYEEEVYCLVKSGRTTLSKSAKAFSASNCDTASNTWVIIVSVIVALLVLLVIVVVALFFLYRRYKRNKEKEYRERNKNGSLGLIIPDGRTYRETELHVIVEKAELLTTEL